LDQKVVSPKHLLQISVADMAFGLDSDPGIHASHPGSPISRTKKLIIFKQYLFPIAY
jgi:hypothetical protein